MALHEEVIDSFLSVPSDLALQPNDATESSLRAFSAYSSPSAVYLTLLHPLPLPHRNHLKRQQLLDFSDGL